ncbi:MAG: tail fiber domain-containing protein [Flavobacteriales bacterium]|nr:tail fiber domain-containing protein [Flavobacteriales bacterium]
MYRPSSLALIFACIVFSFITISVTKAQTDGVIVTGLANHAQVRDASAVLEGHSDNQGFLVPRLTLLQRNAITLPATSLLIFQTDNTPGYYYNSGTPAAPVWVRLFSGASGTPVTGSGAATRVAFWDGTNSLSSNGNLYWDNTNGRLGIGTAAPADILEVVGGALTLSNTYLDINRDGFSKSGISWYSKTYPGWSTYMAQAGQTGVGPHGDLTAPTGAYVNSWALRNYIENPAGYGWTFESAANPSTTPAVKFEIRASDGLFHGYGDGYVDGVLYAGASARMGTNISAGYYQDATNGAYRSLVSAATTNGYYFQTNAGATTTMYVGLGGTYNNRVGIGTSTPNSALQLAGNNYATFGPNSTWNATLRVGGNGNVDNNASVAATNGNLHLDAASGAFATYLNFYRGTAGVIFGNGASGGIGSVDNSGYMSMNNAINSGVGYRISGTAGSGQYLRGNGTNFVSSGIQAGDLPAGNGNYIQNQAGAAQTANWWISGNGTANGTLNALSLGVSNTASNTGRGLSLYNGPTAGQPSYGIMFAGTGTFGTYGSVNSDWATYFTMNDNTARGWIFRRASTNVASVSAAGNLALAGVVTTIQGYTPANNAMRMTPNFHLNAPAGNAIIVNWDNGAVGGTTQQFRVGNGSGTDQFYVRADGAAFGRIWYDLDNSGYYLNGNGTSYLSTIISDANIYNAGWYRGGTADNGHVKLYGNSRTVVFRTDGSTAYGNNGGYPFIWNYGGDDATNRRMILSNDGHLWISSHGWLHDAFSLSSHAHTWAQVTAKPAAWLDGTNLIADLANFNNSVPSGFYQGSAVPNAPSATWYNLINVRHSNAGNDHGFQMAMSYYDEYAYTRTYQGGSGANNGSFTPWARHLTNRPGDWDVASNSNATGYSNATIELRETNFAGAGQQPPRLGFHWSGVVASQISIESNGTISIRNNPGSGYEKLRCLTLRSNGFIEPSDGRLKKNIAPISGALDKVMAIQGVTYNWRKEIPANEGLDDGLQYGLIAQELEKIIPELVDTDEEGWKSVEYSHLVPVLIEALKEQQAEIVSLRKTVDDDRADIGFLKKYLTDLEARINSGDAPSTQLTTTHK